MQILQPPGWARPKGFSNGISCRGRLVFIGGQIGAELTALIPYNDDSLIFGCQDQMYLLAGDPTSGGATGLRVLSQGSGPISQAAYCFGPALCQFARSAWAPFRR